MKRGRHDGDYDQIRREAGYAKPRYEFPDERDDQATRERVERKLAEFKERMAALDAQERQRSAEMLVRLDQRSRDYGRRMLMQEYERAGVTPPIERPVVSLSLLLKIGWRIEEVGGRAALISPMAGQPRRKSREEYEAERPNAEGT